MKVWQPSTTIPVIRFQKTKLMATYGMNVVSITLSGQFVNRYSELKEIRRVPPLDRDLLISQLRAGVRVITI